MCILVTVKIAWRSDPVHRLLYSQKKSTESYGSHQEKGTFEHWRIQLIQFHRGIYLPLLLTTCLKMWTAKDRIKMSG